MIEKHTGKVMSVLGLIEPSELGRTLMHEHLYFDLTAYRSEHETPEDTAFFYEPMTLKNRYRIANDPYSNRDNCINMDREMTLREMSYFKIAGGRTIVDVTPGGVQEGVMATYIRGSVKENVREGQRCCPSPGGGMLGGCDVFTVYYQRSEYRQRVCTDRAGI